MRTALVIRAGIILLTVAFSSVDACGVAVDGCDNEKADCCPAGQLTPLEWELDDLFDCDLGPTAIDELLPE